LTGTYKDFDINKGYGTITGEDKNQYFCHFSAIQSDRISLNVGEVVTFEPLEESKCKRGKTATLVKHA
jgi:cold shock CspA family protein